MVGRAHYARLKNSLAGPDWTVWERGQVFPRRPCMCTSWKRNNCDELSGATERWQHTAGTYQLLQGAWEEDKYENGQGMRG